MGSNYERLFSVLPLELPPEYLCERILESVERERIRQERVRFVISSLTTMSSLVGLVFAIPALLNAAALTGFTSYAPLMVSDSDLVATHLSSFMLSLLEALPGFEVTLTLFLLAVFLVSLKNFISSIASSHLHFRTQTHQSTAIPQV